ASDSPFCYVDVRLHLFSAVVTRAGISHFFAVTPTIRIERGRRVLVLKLYDFGGLDLNCG
ncbi:MAG: hypothetical protein JSW50_10410, partial [Candidatus Latescibacterota bacterium]